LSSLLSWRSDDNLGAVVEQQLAQFTLVRICRGGPPPNDIVVRRGQRGHGAKKRCSRSQETSEAGEASLMSSRLDPGRFNGCGGGARAFSMRQPNCFEFSSLGHNGLGGLVARHLTNPSDDRITKRIFSRPQFIRNGLITLSFYADAEIGR